MPVANLAPPLAPPARPAAQDASEGKDYFASAHNGSHLSLEPNPFEQSFGNPPAETPGKSLLPPVASLTSPASLLRDGAPSAGFSWPNSLRSGPLSPAMLTGPTGGNDYFGEGHLRGGFPTPNESSLRTGLTPGGGGSMFPAASPNSSALLQQLASAGATPGTLDFHRTAMNAARKTDAATAANAGTTADAGVLTAADAAPTTRSAADQVAMPAPTVDAPARAPPQHPKADPFGQHDANDAANGLFLLAQARSGPQPPGQFAAPAPQAATTSAAPTQYTSPSIAKRAARNAGSIGGSIDGSAPAVSEMSGDMSDSGASEHAKPNARGKGKKKGTAGSAGKSATATRRKAEDTPSRKGPPAKKAKSTSASAMPDFTHDSDEEEVDMKADMLDSNGKKMTDEEKRKNFLERNRCVGRRAAQSLLTSQCRRVEVPAAQEAVVGQPPDQGRDFQQRERRAVSASHAAARGDCQPQDAAAGAQGVSRVAGPTTGRHGHEWHGRRARLQPQRQPVWHGHGGGRPGHGRSGHAATVMEPRGVRLGRFRLGAFHLFTFGGALLSRSASGLAYGRLDGAGLSSRCAANIGGMGMASLGWFAVPGGTRSWVLRERGCRDEWGASHTPLWRSLPTNPGSTERVRRGPR